MIAIARKMFCG